AHNLEELDLGNKRGERRPGLLLFTRLFGVRVLHGGGQVESQPGERIVDEREVELGLQRGVDTQEEASGIVVGEAYKRVDAAAEVFGVGEVEGGHSGSFLDAVAGCKGKETQC